MTKTRKRKSATENRQRRFAAARGSGARAMAKRIADDLFTIGSGEKMQRLVLETNSGVLCGGWAYWPAVDRIEAILSAPPNR